MTKSRFSHANCPHPSTKAARATCRAALRAAAEPVAAAALKAGKETKPATAPKRKSATAAAPTVAPEVAISPAREETCTQCGEAFVTTEPEVIDVDPLCDPCAAPAVVTSDAATSAVVEITQDNWREFKSQPANVYVTNSTQPIAAQDITGWSIKFLQITDAEGKRQRIEATTVEAVIAV